MNFSHRLFGVCIGMLTVVLGCGGCGVPQSAVSPPTAAHRDEPWRATVTGIATETLADTSSPAPRQTAVNALAAPPWLASPPEPGPAPGPSTVITAITFEAGADRSIVAVQTAGTPPQVQVQQQRAPTRLALDIKPAHLSPTQQKALTVRDPEGVVTRLEALPGTDSQTDTVRVVVYLRTAAAFEVQQDNDVIRLAIAKSSTATAARVLPQIAPVVRRGVAAAAAPGKAESTLAARPAGLPSDVGLTEPPVFTGEKISLDFQDADISDILRLIAEVGGVNIIAGGDVQGRVTTRMVDVPWDQALDVILKINGLAQERSGNIIRVAPLTKITQERQERVRAQKAEVEAEPLVTRIVPVSYAAVKDLLTNLKTLLTPTRGKMFIDERTNTIILTDTQSTINDVLALVEKLDRPTRQVIIEARIVESNRNFSRQLGIQLGLAFSQITDRVFPNRIDVRGGLTPTTAAPGTLVPPAAPANYLLNLPAAVTAGSGGAIGFSLASIGGALLDAQLSAMESSGRGKIISSPKIATLDNTEALIQSGTTFYVPTVSAEGTRTQAVDAFITLKVTPHVTPDDHINMKITATKNDVDLGTQAANLPTVIKREANTDMLVKDGETVVIGGLYKRSISSSRTGLPGLSSLPVIGWLFRKDTEDDKSEELLIFLTPRIIRQDDAMDKRRTALPY